jgi:hypothetical protein
MSKVIRSRWPHCSATHTAPVTPPAGPDISMVTGASVAPVADCRPPSLRRIASSPRTPPPASSSESVCTYLFTCGWT